MSLPPTGSSRRGGRFCDASLFLRSASPHALIAPSLMASWAALFSQRYPIPLLAEKAQNGCGYGLQGVVFIFWWRVKVRESLDLPSI